MPISNRQVKKRWIVSRVLEHLESLGFKVDQPHALAYGYCNVAEMIRHGISDGTDIRLTSAELIEISGLSDDEWPEGDTPAQTASVFDSSGG
jgi:hypothetical protein